MFFVNTAFGQVAAPAPAAKLGTATPAQAEWLNSSPQERVKISERLGEQGAKTFAAKQGYTPLLVAKDKALAQGFDQVYAAKDRSIVVIEAKGGSSPISHAYGHPQGTPGWAIESAKRVATSSKATAAERQAATAVLEAAREGRLTIQVVRTKHVLGEPVAAVLESSLKASEVESKAAAALLEALPGTGKTGKVVTPSCTKSITVLGKIGKAAGVASAVVDGGIRVASALETEKKFQDGVISNDERATAHAKNAAGYAGGLAGAWAGAKGGAATGGTIGTVFGPVGVPIGATIGGTFGAVSGYLGGERIGKWIVDAWRGLRD